MSVSRETQHATYLSLLQRWGSVLNLTSARRQEENALRDLVEDCLCIIPHLPVGLDRLIDLGSGQGLPAIPIAIETGVTIELLEADRRKAAFLTTALATLGLHGHVHPSRIEHTKLPPARCVTARALAPLNRLVGLAKPFIAEGGCCLFLKGPAVSAELDSLAPDDSIQASLVPIHRPPSTLVKVIMLG